MNNKGITGYETIMYAPRLFYVVVVIASMLGLIFAFTTNNVNVGDIESHVLLHRLHFSPDGLSKQDASTGRVMPGVLDTEKLEDGILNIILSGGDGTLAMRLSADEKTAYLDRETYENWQAIAIAYEQDPELKGSGVKFPHKERRYVYTGIPSTLDSVVITENG